MVKKGKAADWGRDARSGILSQRDCTILQAYVPASSLKMIVAKKFKDQSQAK